MEIKKFWDEAISYHEYLRKAKELLANPKGEIAEDYLEYYKLGVRRMERVEKTYFPDDEQVKALAQKGFEGKILIISEAWCGDASQIIPVVSKFFSQFELRISYRDQEPSLIDHFLTNGAKSIPILVFLNKDLEVLTSWGPRPQYGMELLAKHKANPEAYTSDQFHNDLQVYYAKNKGKDIIAEILEKL